MAKKDELRRRKYPRVKENCTVRFKVVEEAPAECKGGSETGLCSALPGNEGVAVNISGGGMCFASDKSVQPGAMITCEMKLSQLPTPVVSFGKVAWCEQSDAPGKFDIGVEFWWIGWSDQEAQERMLRYVNKKLGPLDADCF